MLIWELSLCVVLFDTFYDQTGIAEVVHFISLPRQTEGRPIRDETRVGCRGHRRKLTHIYTFKKVSSFTYSRDTQYLLVRTRSRKLGYGQTRSRETSQTITSTLKIAER